MLVLDPACWFIETSLAVLSNYQREFEPRLDTMGSARERFCGLGIRLCEDFLRAIHQLKANLKRRRTSRSCTELHVRFNPNHDLTAMCNARANSTSSLSSSSETAAIKLRADEMWLQ